MSFIDLLFHPDIFFKELMQREVSLRMPLLIILIMAVISAISAGSMAGVIGAAMPSEIEGLVTVVVAAAVLFSIIGIFVFWLIWAGVIHGISAILGGNGGFKRVLEVVGYGYLPQIFSAIFAAVVTYDYLGTLDPMSFTDPEAATQFQTRIMSDPMMQLSGIVGIIFLLWSANIWVFGVREAHGISTKNALIAVGVPVLLYLLWTGWTLLGTGGLI